MWVCLPVAVCLEALSDLHTDMEMEGEEEEASCSILDSRRHAMVVEATSARRCKVWQYGGMSVSNLSTYAGSAVDTWCMIGATHGA